MNHLLYKILIVLFTIFVSSVYSQSDDFEMEVLIKSSENYIYNQVVAPTENEAKQSALANLIESEAFRLASQTNKQVNRSNVQFLVKESGNRYRAIAYIDKNIAAETLVKPVNESITTPKVDNAVNNEVSNYTKEEPPKTTVVKSTPAKTENKTEPTVKSESRNMSFSIPVASVWLKEIEKMEDCNALIKVLDKYKYSGALAYSLRSDAFNNISDCYIISCDQNSIKLAYILGKGTDTRINLYDGAKINIEKESSTKKLLNIYVYEF
jgi:hypothetical protein